MEPLSLALQTPAGVAMAGVAMAALSSLVMLLRSRIEDRRRIALGVSSKLTAIGFQYLPKVLEAYGIGDYSGALREMITLHEVLHDKEKRVVALKEAGKNILKDLYQDPAYRQEIDDFIQGLRDQHLRDKASQFASAIDDVADQESLLEKMKAVVAARKERLQAFGTHLVDDVKTVAPIAAAAVAPPLAPVAAAVAAAAPSA